MGRMRRIYCVPPPRIRLRGSGNDGARRFGPAAARDGRVRVVLGIARPVLLANDGQPVIRSVWYLIAGGAVLSVHSGRVVFRLAWTNDAGGTAEPRSGSGRTSARQGGVDRLGPRAGGGGGQQIRRRTQRRPRALGVRQAEPKGRGRQRQRRMCPPVMPEDRRGDRTRGTSCSSIIWPPCRPS